MLWEYATNEVYSQLEADLDSKVLRVGPHRYSEGRILEDVDSNSHYRTVQRGKS